MIATSDCDNTLKSLLTSLGLKDSSDLAIFCSRASFSISARTFKVLLNVAIILNYQGKFDVAYKIVKILFSKHSLSSANLGTSISVAFLLIEVALNCHYRERNEEEYLSCVGDAFKLLDKAYEMLNSQTKESAGLLTKAINSDGSGVEFYEAVCVILFCQTAFYKSNVCFALQDNMTAKQIINNALEIIWKYLQFVMSEEPLIWIEGLQDGKKSLSQPFLTDYLNVMEAESIGSVKGKISLSTDSINVIKSKICHICRLGTSLNAKAEFFAGNFQGSKAICAQLRILENLPNAIEDRRISLNNNEACIFLQLREFHSASAQVTRSVQDICQYFASISIPKSLPDLSRVAEEKPLNVMNDAEILGCLYNTGLVWLKLSRPLEAFLYFEKIVSTSTISKSVVDQPYIWIRLAECCLQQDAISTSATNVDPLFLQVVSVSKGRSRRLQIVSSVAKADIPATPLKEDANEVVQRCTLSAAIIYLKKSLEVNQKLKNSVKKPSEGDLRTFREKELQRLIQLDNNALLRLTYIYLKLQDPVSALEYVQRLVDQINNEEFSPFRYLAFNYYLEVLCQLGKHEKAGAFLKSQFDVNYSDAVIANCYMSSDLFRGNATTSSKIFLSQFKLPPNVAAMSLQVNKAIVLILRGLYSSAVSILEAVVRSNPAFMPAVKCLMYVYIRQGKVKQTLNLINISQKAKI